MVDLFPPLSREEQAAEHAPSTVCVTGATGYVAAAIVQRLLAGGHTVRATVRDPSNKAKVGFLEALPGPGRLELCRADLLEEGSFDAAVAGCEYVVHTASPYVVSIPASRVQEALIDPALKGTENVLGSVNRAPTIKRVVLTSSVVALYGDPEERGKGHVFGEGDWGIKSSVQVLPYFYSKKVAEQRAWEICRQQSRWDLVTILPGQVWGPPIPSGAGSSPSVAIVRDLLNGKDWPFQAPIGMGFVDVRDVALAHVKALLNPSASGRYICVSSTHTLLDASLMLREKYPERWLPKLAVPYTLLWLLGPTLGVPRAFVTFLYGKLPQFDTSRTRSELGINFIDARTMLHDEAERLFELGLVK